MKDKGYIKASSLIETVIAITIITLCSLIATLVYTSIINQTPPIKKYEYEFVLEKLIQETITKNTITPYKKQFEGFTIEKKVVVNQTNSKLKNVLFLISTNKETIQYPLVVFNENEEN